MRARRFVTRCRRPVVVVRQFRLTLSEKEAWGSHLVCGQHSLGARPPDTFSRRLARVCPGKLCKSDIHLDFASITPEEGDPRYERRRPSPMLSSRGAHTASDILTRARGGLFLSKISWARVAMIFSSESRGSEHSRQVGGALPFFLSCQGFTTSPYGIDVCRAALHSGRHSVCLNAECSIYNLPELVDSVRAGCRCLYRPCVQRDRCILTRCSCGVSLTAAGEIVHEQSLRGGRLERRLNKPCG